MNENENLLHQEGANSEVASSEIKHEKYIYAFPHNLRRQTSVKSEWKNHCRFRCRTPEPETVRCWMHQLRPVLSYPRTVLQLKHRSYCRSAAVNYLPAKAVQTERSAEKACPVSYFLPSLSQSFLYKCNIPIWVIKGFVIQVITVIVFTLKNVKCEFYFIHG